MSISVECPDLSDPDSGYVKIDTDGQTSTANFSCDTGYKIVGTDILICQTNGSWSDSSPICGKKEWFNIKDYDQHLKNNNNKELSLCCSKKVG